MEGILLRNQYESDMDAFLASLYSARHLAEV